MEICGHKLWPQKTSQKCVPFLTLSLNKVLPCLSVLRSPLAIQVNIGIIRAFVDIRRMVVSLPQPDVNADAVQLRKDFDELKRDIEDILANQNEINEDTRVQLDVINEALAQLQSDNRQPRRPILGFSKPNDNK